MRTVASGTHDLREDTVRDATSVQAYTERDLKTRIQGMFDRLAQVSPKDLDEDLRDQLRLLANRILEILGEG